MVDINKILSIIGSDGNHNRIYNECRKIGYIDDILLLTSFLDDYYNKVYFKQRIWHIKNNLYHLIVCDICKSNPSRFHKCHGYTCCSKKCSDKKRKISLDLRCLKIYGVDNPMKSQIIKNKRSKTIKNIYGVDNYSKTDGFRTFMKENNPMKRDNVKAKNK